MKMTWTTTLVSMPRLRMLPTKMEIEVEIIDLKPLFTNLTGANDSEAVNIHFEATGYDSSDFQINAGPALLIIFLAPLYFLLTFTLSRCCQKQKCKLWAQQKVKETYFNTFISFMEAEMLFLSTAANINTYRVVQGSEQVNSSFCMACLLLGVTLL